MKRPRVTVHWFRRDLRLHDNHALLMALRSGHAVLPVFIFDTNILDDLQDKQDRRVDLIHRTLRSIKAELESLGSSLHVEVGDPMVSWQRIIEQYDVQCVHANRDHEPYALQRDKDIEALLGDKNISFVTHKDHSIFERNEVVKQDGTPYTVFTPYMRKWREQFTSALLDPFSSENELHALHPTEPLVMASLAEIGFRSTDLALPTVRMDEDLLRTYTDTRNLPAIEGTSKLSMYLRFGMVSVCDVLRKSWAVSPAFANELIWREFFMQILWHFPRVVTQAFKPGYDNIAWRNDPAEFSAWCEGRTGYPIVDAGMRELNATGLMHNRVRMITASFLTKHLLIDWRWGEAWFAAKLLDFELSSNNGNWQWACGSGCDAAPYFRVFSPAAQTERFDPDLRYVKHWVPEAGTAAYPTPIVDHDIARKRALYVYKSGLTMQKGQVPNQPQLFF